MGQTTDLEYDANGNPSTVTDPLGRPTTRAYDALDRISQLTDAANGVTQYAYDRVENRGLSPIVLSAPEGVLQCGGLARDLAADPQSPVRTADPT